MRTRFVVPVLVASVAVLCPAPGSAQDRGFNLGLRTSYAAPMGEAGDGADLADLTSEALPFQLDLVYRIDRHWRLGAFFAYGPALIADDASRDLEAAGLTDVGGHRQQSLGVEVERVLRAGSRVRPWIGLGGGYEWTRYAAAKLPSGLETEIGRSGWVGTMTVGADIAVSSKLAVGPYVAMDLGQYGRTLVWVEDGDTVSKSIADTGLHQWVRVGVRLSWAF